MDNPGIIPPAFLGFHTWTPKTPIRILPLDENPYKEAVWHPLEVNLEVPCKRRPKAKFGFGCPYCEMLLDRYPEDRNEGGIE
jgi:hypothetical protein